jgi:TRAP-type C4-dicarboxylate transport system substrate-binding protein
MFEQPKVQGVKLTIDGKVQIVDLRGWDRLPSEQQRRILKNQNNARAVDALYQEQQERKAAARVGR